MFLFLSFQYGDELRKNYCAARVRHGNSHAYSDEYMHERVPMEFSGSGGRVIDGRSEETTTRKVKLVGRINV